ncbi:hypothetical protein HNR19_001577 [Nocardioides thalensis]|uniref:Secreted protein n=1 Tax=Nocardioides thalensis TaxID=1914755 RepID=A0A853C0I0_9ACTN|nr:hypothetical protein [Nocardioides thalensis]NYJ00879.1 hypothetical protein [Nocardioides thalensis]
MPRTLRAVALICLTAVAVALPASANAERWTTTDPREDVRGVQFTPEPPPCGTHAEIVATEATNEDITRLRVRHTRTHVHLRARFRDLDEALEQNVTFHLATDDNAWMLDILRWQRNDGTFRRVQSFLAQTPEEPEPEDIDECGGYMIGMIGINCRTSPEIDHEADVITAAIPRRCVSNPRWVRAGVENYGDSEVGGTPTFLHDQWGDAADTDSLIVSPLGARVRAPRGADVRQTAGPAPTSGRAVGLVGGPGYRWVRQ